MHYYDHFTSNENDRSSSENTPFDYNKDNVFKKNVFSITFQEFNTKLFDLYKNCLKQFVIEKSLLKIEEQKSATKNKTKETMETLVTFRRKNDFENDETNKTKETIDPIEEHDLLWNTDTAKEDQPSDLVVITECDEIQEYYGSTLEEHMRINAILRQTSNIFVDERDPLSKKIKLSTKKSLEKKKKKKEFFVKTLNTCKEFSFFKTIWNYIYNNDREYDTKKTWRDVMHTIIDYTSRLCFDASFDDLYAIELEGIFSRFIINSILCDSCDSYDSDFRAKFTFFFRVFFVNTEVSILLKEYQQIMKEEEITNQINVNDGTKFGIHLIKLKDVNYLVTLLKDLSNENFTMKQNDKSVDETLLFLFEPIVCCMFRTGLVHLSYESSEKRISLVRRYVNDIVADETNVFMYIVTFNGIVDNLIWCEEKKKTQKVSVSYVTEPTSFSNTKCNGQSEYDIASLWFDDTKEEEKDYIFTDNEQAYFRYLYFHRKNKNKYFSRYMERKRDFIKKMKNIERAKIVTELKFNFYSDEDVALSVKNNPQYGKKKPIFDIMSIQTSEEGKRKENIGNVDIIYLWITNASNGFKALVEANLVFDSNDNLCGIEKGEEIYTCSCTKALLNTLDFECILLLKKRYGIYGCRTYRFDFEDFRFDVFSNTIVTFSTIMFDMKEGNILVLQYDEKTKNNKKNELIIEEEGETFDLSGFKIVYYRNHIDFSRSEGIVDVNRSSFPLCDRWTNSKLFFVWYRHCEDEGVSDKNKSNPKIIGEEQRKSYEGVSNLEMELFVPSTKECDE